LTGVNLARQNSTFQTGTIMNFKHIIRTGLIAATCAAWAGAMAAGEQASKEEAIAMVKKGVVFMKANGKEKGHAEISNKKGQFIDRDLYLVVYGLDGTVRAHGANDKMIGKDLIELKDVDGKPFVKERVDMAKTQATFWQDYKFTNPVLSLIHITEPTRPCGTWRMPSSA
jgi:cytochrome c